ncbi:uncharacterized protein [Clytia hemisphaerica]
MFSLIKKKSEEKKVSVESKDVEGSPVEQSSLAEAVDYKSLYEAASLEIAKLKKISKEKELFVDHMKEVTNVLKEVVRKNDEELLTVKKEHDAELDAVKQACVEKVVAANEEVEAIKKESEDDMTVFKREHENNLAAVTRACDERLAAVSKACDKRLAAVTKECNDKLEAVTKDFKGDLAYFKQELVVVKKEREENAMLVKDLRHVNTYLTSDLKRSREQLQQTEQELADTKKECLKLEVDVRELKDLTKTQMLTIQDIETRNKELEQENKTLIQDLKEVNCEVADIKTELIASKEAVKGLDGKLRYAEAKSTEQVAEIEQLKQELQTVHELKDVLEEKYKIEVRENVSRQHEIDDYKSRELRVACRLVPLESLIKKRMQSREVCCFKNPFRRLATRTDSLAYLDDTSYNIAQELLAEFLHVA